jgi:acyl-ACP thioesterase
MEMGIYKSDIDNNEHVNNIRYFHWLIESLPEEIVDNYYLKLINAKFLAEARYGEKVQIYVKEGFEKNTFSHTMKNDISNTLYVSATSKWEKI